MNLSFQLLTNSIIKTTVLLSHAIVNTLYVYRKINVVDSPRMGIYETFHINIWNMY